MRREAHEVLARLTAQAAIQNAKVRSDPLPFLRDAEREMFLVRKLMDDLDYALSGMSVMPERDSDRLAFRSPESVLHERITEAQKVIRKYHTTAKMGRSR